MRARRLATIRDIIVAAPAYLNRRGRPEHPVQLAEYDCFAYTYFRTRGTWHLSNAAGERVTVRPSNRLQVNNGDALLPASLAGLGISPLPAFIVRDAAADGTLEQVLPDWQASRAGLHLLTPLDGPRPV